MPIIGVVGVGWGDEGKGTHVDRSAEHADVVVRYSGGANSGHTVETPNEQGKTEKFVMHNLPCGIVRKGMLNVVGPYVAVDPLAVEIELVIMERFGGQLAIDERAPLVTPLHIALDKAREKSRGKGAIGTTARGVGPCYEDYTARHGFRVKDLFDSNIAGHLARGNYYDEKCRMIEAHGATPPSREEMYRWYFHAGEILSDYWCDTGRIVREIHEKNGLIIAEGAQSELLSYLTVSHPHCTSSICNLSAFSASFGIPIDRRVDRVIAVVKSYPTIVDSGNGPFPTEMDESLAAVLRERGNEYGATSGRPRRIGHPDFRAMSYAAKRIGATEVVITKLDILTGVHPLKVCIEYGRTPINERDETRIDRACTLTEERLREAQPIYTELQGWDEDISRCTVREELPFEAQRFIALAGGYFNLPVTSIGVGPRRDQVIT